MLNREIEGRVKDIELLLLERMRLIDSLSWWPTSTMKTYAPYLSFLGRFENHYGASVLTTNTLVRPPCSPGIALIWA
jgi:hypothetical protein